ncbi:MAG: nucleotidyltransferase domain-containing protein [Anaerolineae bacterium]
MSVNENLVAQLRQILPDILHHTPVRLAYLYGSMATGQTLPSSDVDIALVLGRTGSSPKERMQLEFAVEAALEQQGILKPDVRVIDDLPLTFRGQVAIQGLRLYARDEAERVEFETRTWKEYLDFEPVTRMMSQALREHLQTHGLSKG